MGENMIERVARAICDSVEADNFDELCEGTIGKAIYRQQARAAIEAMREPTDEMKVSGGLKCEAMMFERDTDGSGVIFDDMGHVYRAMIDAALSKAGHTE